MFAKLMIGKNLDSRENLPATSRETAPMITLLEASSIMRYLLNRSNNYS